MKKILAVILLLIIAVFAWLKFSNQAEELVLKELERQGRRAFGTEVIVSDLDLDIKAGTASIREISVANPPGFTQQNALTLSEIYAQFDYRNLSISEIIVSDPHVYAEFIDSKLNIEQLAEQAKKFAPVPVSEVDVTAGGESTSEPGAENAEAEEDSINLTINYIALENITVDLISDKLKEQKQFGIDQIAARDLSGTPGQLGNQIINKMLTDLYQRVAAESLKELGIEKLDELKEKVKDKLKNLFN